MAPVKVDPANVREFKNADAFYKWLGKNHDKAGEVWIKIHKLKSGLAIDHAEGGDRCRAVLGLDRRHPQEGLDETQLSAALFTARQKERAGARSTSTILRASSRRSA